MEFQIGDKIKVIPYGDLPEKRKNKGIARACDREGVVIDKLYSNKRCSPSYEHYFAEIETIEEVVFYKGAFCFKVTIEGIAMYRPIGIDIYEKQKIKDFEVIGNIYDKPTNERTQI